MDVADVAPVIMCGCVVCVVCTVPVSGVVVLTTVVVVIKGVFVAVHGGIAIQSSVGNKTLVHQFLVGILE